jgi:hypothetical protein
MMQLEIYCILHLKVVDFLSHNFGTLVLSLLYFMHVIYNLDSGILVFIFLCKLIYQMMTVGIF